MRYKALRDFLTDSTKGVARRLWSAIRDRNLRLSAFRRLGVSKEDFWALKDVSFEVHQGDVIGIIGRNGAGKSTLLRILSRITEPSEGRVRLRGRVASLLEVGTGFHPELTGRENIFLNGAILGMSHAEIKAKFDEIVAFAEVEKFLDTPVKRYSSGMYVRLAFAVAAHLEPEILIVDEVLAVGDAEFQKKCLGKMKDVATGGRTVLFVSHNMAAVQELTKRGLYLCDGRIVGDGPSQAIARQYLAGVVGGSQGAFDLTHHRAREQSRTPLISALAIVGEAGMVTGHVFPDETVTFELEIRARTPLKNPRIALAVEDSHNRRIMTMASYFSSREVGVLAGTRIVGCRVSGLGLAPGRYLLSASVGTKSEGLIDSVDCACGFEVGWRNNYGNGEMYLRDYGPVLKPSEWNLVES